MATSGSDVKFARPVTSRKGTLDFIDAVTMLRAGGLGQGYRPVEPSIMGASALAYVPISRSALAPPRRAFPSGPRGTLADRAKLGW